MKRRRSALERDIKQAAALEPGLYVVATPIGNLGDITLRALDVLRRADTIAAEDTRNTRGLLNHFGIAGKLVALHEHNERRATAGIVRDIGAGKAVALVSDAGTPAVGDPGAELVPARRAAGLKGIPGPGAGALTAPLSPSRPQF